MSASEENLEIQFCNIHWKKSFIKEHKDSSLKNIEETKSNNMIGTAFILEKKIVVPGVIRHTSHPTHSMAYYIPKQK